MRCSIKPEGAGLCGALPHFTEKIQVIYGFQSCIPS